MAENDPQKVVKISVCISTHNQPDLLLKCVGACFAEFERAGISGEVVIVDNGSADRNPRGLSLLYPAVRIIRNEQNLSFSVAYNQAIQASQGEYVLILNDDVILLPGSLALLTTAIESDPEIGAVGPKLLNPDGSAQTTYMHDRLPHVRGTVFWLLHLSPVLARKEWTRKLFTFTRNPEVSGSTQVLVGACLLARRDALIAAGLFDEQFHYMFEDVDLCFQLRRRGWRMIYVADARVTHYGSSSLKTWSSSRFLSTLTASILYYFKKDSKLWQYVLLRGTLVLLVFCRMWFVAFQGLFRPGSMRTLWTSTLRGHLMTLAWLLGTRLGSPIYS